MTTAATRLRHGGMTIREIAKVLNISAARVRQLEEQALRKLAQDPGLLREFVDFSTIRPEEGPHR